MALEAIKEVKKAESTAEELIKDANAKAKEMIQIADKEALNEYNEVLNE